MTVSRDPRRRSDAPPRAVQRGRPGSRGRSADGSVGGEGSIATRGAWQHVEPPAGAADEGQTFCPYKGLAWYYNIGDTRSAAWSYRVPFEEVERIRELVSFYPEKLTITIDGEKLEAGPGQNVLPHGPDRNLTVDEIGGIQLVEDTVTAAG